MKHLLLVLSSCLPALAASGLQAEEPLLLQKPTVSRTHVVFSYAGDLWSVGRQGGDARQLTSGVGIETDPVFSPDGTQIAFSGEYDGNRDVYVMPATGGVPRRLTYHPGPEGVAGWTPDGKSVLFWSIRTSYSRFSRLFTMSLDGGLPIELPLPMGVEGAFSPDGTHIAYTPFPPAFRIWKRYRGGRTTPIWIANLANSHIEKVPRDNSNDVSPMWLGNRVYFLSDRNGPVTLFAYDPATKQVTQMIPNTGLDIKSASAGPDVIVYEQFGTIHLFDPKTTQTRQLAIRVSGDLASVRPRFEKVAKRIQNAGVSPTGVRAVFEARGEILTVPAEKGDIRNLTNTPSVAERDPAWSPDGKWIAYFSDESGEYRLHVREQHGGQVRRFDLGNPPSFYYAPVWSPDNKKIAYTDKRLNLWCLNLDKGTSTHVDTNTYDLRTYDPVWSPDSKWIAYTRQLKNAFNAVFVYSLETSKKHQVTDGMSDARYAVFDKNGKYLYFTASTDVGLTVGGSEMSSLNRPITRSVYVVVLNKDLPSPLAPQSDEEKEEPAKSDGAADKEKSKEKKPEPVTVRIDFENIDQRILALPIAAHNYLGMLPGKAGTLFVLEGPVVSLDPVTPDTNVTIQKFDLEKRKTDKFTEGVAHVAIAHNGEKLLYRQGERWFLVASAQPPKPGEGALKVEDMEVRVDPPAEWKQMYHEVWRIERDYLYDPGFHGYDLKAAEKRYEPYLARLGSRSDLNYLFAEMLGELTLGHVYVQGGDMPEVKRVRGGLLGADYRAENGRYRFARIYQGQNWHPQLKAPLTQPGLNVKESEYLLAVNGRELRATDNLYSFFEGTAGKSVLLKVGPNADGKGSREVTVVPIPSDIELRNLTWIEENRRKVDQMTGGRIAYVYLPDTYMSGFTHFNRYYFSQTEKDGAVIDERFNGGGLVADYVIDYLRRPLLHYWATREGEVTRMPQAAIQGPKAMIVNEFAGSGGDLMPWLFRKMAVGPLIGKRTWGGLVGIDDYPTLIDGGAVTAPRAAFFNLQGEWEVENRGVAPDIEVEFDPEAVRAGRDPQLEKAVQVVLEELNKNPPPKYKKPAYPNYHKAGITRKQETGTGR